MSKYIPKELTLEFMMWRYTNLPEHENKTPKIHYKLIDYFSDCESDGYALAQCFRGMAKTQLAMEFSLFCICEGHEKYILFVGSTIEMTSEIVNTASDLAEEIKSIKVTRRVDGVLEIINRYGESAFMVAKSTGSKLRGISKSGKDSHRSRPTMIVIDDIVSDDLVENPYRMKKAVKWLYSSLIPTLVPGGKVIGSGTPNREGDPFLSLVQLYGSFKVPLTEDAWPDRFSKDWIDKKEKQYKDAGQYREFLREFKLELTDSEDKVFDVKKINVVDESEVDIDELSWFIALDGAFTEKDSGDYSAFACVGVDGVGRWYAAVYDMKDRPQKVIDKLFELQSKYRSLDVGIEKGIFNLAMKSEIEQKQLDYQQYFSIKELSVSGSKLTRIKALAPIVESRRLTLIDTGDATERLLNQLDLISIESINSEHDDHIDALSQIVQMTPSFFGSNKVNLSDYYDDDEYDDDNAYGGNVFNT